MSLPVVACSRFESRRITSTGRKGRHIMRHNTKHTISDSEFLSVTMGGVQEIRHFPRARERVKPEVPLAVNYRFVDIPVSSCSCFGLCRICLLTQFNTDLLRRALFIISEIGNLYPPLKHFSRLSLPFFVPVVGHYLSTFTADNRLTDMSALLLSMSGIVFLIGLGSEQVTRLVYRKWTGKSDRSSVRL